MTKLTLNKTAIAQLGGNDKVRVRVTYEGLQLRPTNRVSGKRLPKGEKLISVKRMGIFSQIDLAAFGDTSTAFAPVTPHLVPAKHGWLSLVTGADKPTVKIG